tara:strand:- start:6918 stop:8033 length:1116 start_codon:yes stop_codon:yes gene_type:complete
MKAKLMIVGAFPKKKNKIFGGVVKSSKILINSEPFKYFDIIPFDSSQISNPPPVFIVRFFLSILRIIRFLYTITYKKPDVILIFCSSGPSALEKGLMILISNLLSVKTLIFPRAGNLINQTKDSQLFRGLIKFLFSKADIFLAQGPTWSNFAINDLKINSKKTSIVNNWTATKGLLEVGKKRIIKDKKDNLTIIYVGWLEKQKGIIELLESFYNLIKSYDLKIKFIGDGSLRDKIDKYCTEKNIEDRVFISGWLSNSEILANLKSSDVFVLPSWHEGMPNSLIEALASGLPSISSNVGIIPDYIKHNLNGLLIEPKNKLILEKTIEKTINDVNLRKSLSKNGHKLAEKMFSDSISLNKLANEIKKLSNEKK